MLDKANKPLRHMITIVTDDEVLPRTIDYLLEQLKTRKPEFESVKVERISPAQGWQKKINSALLNKTFLLFCDRAPFWDLVHKLRADEKANGVNHVIPIFAILDEYEPETIDEVFRVRYLYTRGVVTRKGLGDPEDLGSLARAIKDEFRRGLSREGLTPAKKVGWKVGSSRSGKSPDRFVSLFLDPVMRDFMQSLVFTIESIKIDMPEPTFDDAGLRTMLKRIENDRQEAAGDAFKMFAGGQGELAPRPKPVLLEGETGAGKTVIAKWIHRHLSGVSAPLPFQRVSTVNIGANILEAELFGTLKGAWSDAITRPGKLLLAWGGIVFLDEIGDLPPEMQAKFLVYLDELKFTPDGWDYPWNVFSPVYIIAATNKDLKKAIRDGSFRDDLYYRFPHRLRVPSLRERRSDLRPSIDFLLQDPTVNSNGWVQEISLAAVTRLEQYDFPGNFRELESILSRATFNAMRAGRRIITEEDLEL